MVSFQLNSDQANQAAPNSFIDSKLTDALNIDLLSIAFRCDLSEFNNIISNAGFCQEYLHEEEACISGRFVKAAL